MKLIQSVSVVLLCLLFVFVSCSDDTEPEADQITLSEKSLSVSTDGGNVKFTVTSNRFWQMTTKSDWCTITPSSGNEGTVEVTVSIKPNLSGKERNSKLVFRTETATATLSLEQKEQLVVDPSSKNVRVEKKGGVYAIVSGSEYQATVPESVKWITFSETNGVLKMTINTSEEVVERIAIVTFKHKKTSESKDFLVIQGNSQGTNQMLQIKTMTIGGMPCIIDIKSLEVYFSVDMDASPVSTHKLEFSGLGIDYLTINDKKVKSGETFTFNKFEAKTSIVIKAHNDLIEEPKTTALNITGLPLVSIHAPEGIVDEPKRPCDMIIIDPKGRTNFGAQKGLKYFETYAGIEWRGSGALRYDKKAYGFKLREKGTEASIDAEILGLRDDNNWILDAMWLDKAKMRNRVCFDLWNEFNELYYKLSGDEKKAQSGTHGHLVEVFLDGAYHGLYVLSDKLDRKQLKLKKDGGYLYKLGDWTDECLLRGYTSNYNNNSLIWNGVEMDYPDEIGKVEFKYYKELIDFVAKSSKEDFAANFESRIDMANMVDCFIFTNLILAYDNIGRNTYWGIYDIKKSNKMIPLIWDLDGTLGRTWDQKEEDPNSGWVVNSRHNGSSYKIYQRILEENPANIHTKIKERWNDIKNKALSTSNVNSKLDYYGQQQINSGAEARERNRWNSGYTNVATEIAYIKSWYAKRWAKINELVNGL